MNAFTIARAMAEACLTIEDDVASFDLSRAAAMLNAHAEDLFAERLEGIGADCDILKAGAWIDRWRARLLEHEARVCGSVRAWPS